MSNVSAPTQDGGAEKASQHEHETAEREAYEYWGYLFKSDKTGTDRLKGLLRGLKELMNEHYEPSDNPDLTPTQLASFYRELNGNYDRLFLGTPSDSIAFIYKSLGCVHSLQPLPHSTAFTDPTVPALKTEGWIMWQTIQLLLGPEEHSEFLREAVQKWEVKDPLTGEVFPTVLPRQCFPPEPDKHMVAWYEGVSERLRREAEEEEKQREIEAEQAETRRLSYRKRDEGNPDDESVDSRKSALAYFRDPLYRQDGRPTIVTRNSKRPHLSPRRSSMKDRVKEGATTAGHVIRNIGSPHLWDGRHASKSESRERDKDRRRRSSLPENRYHQGNDLHPPGQDHTRASSYNSSHSHSHSRSRHQHQDHNDRRGSSAHPLRTADDTDGWNADDEETPVDSSRPASRLQHGHHDTPDSTLRHTRSAEPTPSQKEITDYFYKFDEVPDEESGSHSVTPNGMGPSFGPSASPLFASHVAKQPQPPGPYRPAHPQADHGPARSSRHYDRPSENRSYSRSPHPPDRNDGRYSSRERRHSPRGHNGGPTSMPQQSRHDYPPIGRDPGRSSRSGSHYPSGGHGTGHPTRDRRRSGRMSGSDLSGPDDMRRGSMQDDGRRGSGPPPPEDGRRGGGKQTRFASVSGVDGRRFPNESGWR